MTMNIFIELPTWLGDATMATPAIENIAATYPEAQLTLFGASSATQLFLDHPLVSKIVVDGSKSEGFRYTNLYRYAKEMGSFDLALSFRSSLSSKFLLFFIDAKAKYIYKRDTSQTMHQVLRYNTFINQALKIDTQPSKLKIYTAKSEKKPSKPQLGINAGATYGSAKRWYPKEFATCAVALSKKYDILLFGSPSEAEMVADIEYILTQKGITNYQNLAGKTTVRELIDKVALLDLFITNDSGPMHLAAAFDIPTIAIFGPTQYNETSQWMNEQSIIISKDLSCSPCMKRTCPLKHHECMKLITAHSVLAKIKKAGLF
ncbi:MAG: glycosyltransferase family 9 protein [Campylobacterales bacterium]|nr:glycosyltransferase family 9 protein [Campylobacterales bacterium]